jgi:hypothetical protein
MSKQKKAIAQIADCKQSDLVKQPWDHYGLTLYAVGHGPYAKEYAVGTDEEMNEAAKQYIEGSLWAFNASFLAEYTDLPEEIFTALQPKCEGANDPILQLVERSDGGLEGFVEQAIEEDGRSHFLSSYDGEEHEVTVYGNGVNTTLYVVRV